MIDNIYSLRPDRIIEERSPRVYLPRLVETSELPVLIREFSEYQVLIFEFLNPFHHMGNQKAFLQNDDPASRPRRSELLVPVLHS